MNSTASGATFRGNDRILIGFILAVLTFWLFANAMMNLSPLMTADLGVERNTTNMAVSLAALFSGAFIVVAGGLADRLGRVKILRIGIWLAIAGSLLLAVAPSGALAAPALMAGRALQGLSAACVMSTSLGLVKLLWDGAGRQRAISYWSIGTFGGSGLSSLFGGIIATNFGWRWVFVLAAVVAVVALVLLKDLPESKKEDGEAYQPDWIGIIFFLIAMLSAQVLITKGGQIGWTSWLAVTLAAIALAFFWLFYAHERKSPIAFFDFALFRNSVFAAAVGCNFFINATAGILIVALPLMQQAAGYSSQQAGLLTLGYAFAVIVFIRVGEKLLQRHGARKPVMWGSLIVAAAMILMMQTHVMTGTYQVLAIAGFFLFGVGLAFFATPATDAALSNLPAEQAGAGAGIFKMASSIGVAIGVAVAAGVYTSISAGEPLDWLMPSMFTGRQDNVAFRQGALLANGTCLLFALSSFLLAMRRLPKQQKATS